MPVTLPIPADTLRWLARALRLAHFLRDDACDRRFSIHRMD